MVQLEDGVPYTLPTFQQPDLVFQGPEINHSLDIRVHHDQVELKMMEVFQQLDAKCFNSHAFVLITVEIPCSKSQPAFSQLTPYPRRLTLLITLVRLIIWLHGYIGPLSVMI